MSADARRSQSALRPSLSTSVTAISGRAMASARPGKPAPLPMSTQAVAEDTSGRVSPARLSARWRSMPSSRPVDGGEVLGLGGDPVEQGDERRGGGDGQRDAHGARTLHEPLGGPPGFT